MPKRSSKHQGPTDLNELAARIAGEAAGEEPASTEETPGKNPHAQALGRLGGKKGGEARAQSLTAAERQDIARRAAQARWQHARDKQ